MRLITRDLHRAFPELDRFDDARALRFVAAARKGRTAAIARGLVATAVALLAAIFVTVPLLYLFNAVEQHNPGGLLDHYPIIRDATIAIAGFGTFGLLAMVLRDRLLRGRVRRFISTKGRCPECRYVLLGLPVPDSLSINCPECGLEMEVDPALLELAEPATPPTEPSSSTPAAVPQSGSPKPARRIATVKDDRWLPDWISPRFVRRFIRWSLTITAAVILVVAGCWGWFEWSVRSQAALARSQRTGMRGIAAIAREINPPPANGENGWPILERASEGMEKAEAEVLSAAADPNDPDPPRIYPNYSLLSESALDSQRQQESTDNHQRKNILLAHESINLMRQRGVFDLLDSFTSYPYAAREWPTALIDPEQFGIQAVPGSWHQLAIVNASRMALASANGDLAEFLAACRANLVMVRMLEREPLFLPALIAISTERFTLARIERILMKQPPAGWPEAIHTELSLYPTGLIPFKHALNGERSLALDKVASIFSDPSSVKRFTIISTLESMSGESSLDQSMGSYTDNVDELNRIFDLAEDRLTKPKWQRGPLPYNPGPTFQIAGLLLRDLEGPISAFDNAAAQRHGTLIMLALERFRAGRGRYPATLEELVPSYLSTIPVDTFTGLPLRYVLKDPATDPHGRGYWLYSMGVDRQDNNGNHPPDSLDDSALRVIQDPQQPGYDYIFNTPDLP